MRTVVIGDLHGRSTWKLITYIENPDRVIFIGDYFDSFEIPGKEQVRNFLDILDYKDDNSKTEVILLVGNHDLHYFPEIGQNGTGGYQIRMAPTINEIIDSNRSNLQAAYQMGDFLFTHAGVSVEYMNNNFGTTNGWRPETVAMKLNELLKYQPRRLDFDKNGSDPTGNDEFQSPLWIRPGALMSANWRTDLEDQFIQVFGHTSTMNVKSWPIKSNDKRYYCVDTMDYTGEYLVIEDGEVIIKSLK